MNKSAMQELKNIIENHDSDNIPKQGLLNIINLMSLEKEKQQIIDASVQANLRYDSSANEPVTLRYINDAEEYYSSTFKQD